MFGPALVARIRQASGQYGRALIVLAIVMLVSVIVPLLLRPPKQPRPAELNLDRTNQERRSA